MSLFDVAARIFLDTSAYENGLNDASRRTQSFGQTVNAGMKKLGGAVKTGLKAASAAAVAFGVASIKTGADFDAAMSQVAATMGKTTDEVQDLRKFAQQMGETTKFSATEAAEALNYMALAGYDSQKAMAMLPNVLNLAAAGGIELAQASDMVTDAQSALGLSMEETNKMVDQMAAASSKSNTSVAQLGEAFLTVGGTAKSLSGGTVELATAIGVLSDNGVKSAESGTALRNIILSLSAPTDKAAKTMASLGLEAFDADGNMRPLSDTFGDLNEILSTMTEQKRTQVLNELFNKVDLKSVNAMLGTSAERWEELSAAIEDSQGAAEKMSKTQLDNLKGDVTILKSAFEGLQIAVSDKATPAMRTFVQSATDGISKITEFVKNLDFSGESISQIGNDILYMVVGLSGKIREKAGELTDAGIEIIASIARGITENAPTIARSVGTIFTNIAGAVTDNAPKIIENLVSGIKNNLPKLVTIAADAALKFSDGLRKSAGKMVDAGIKLLLALADGLIKSLPTLIKTVPTIVSNIAGIINDNAPKLIKAGIQLIVMLAKGIVNAIPTLIKEFPKIVKAIIDVWTAVNWISLGRTLITGIVNGVRNLAPKIPEFLRTVGNKAAEVFRSIDWRSVGRVAIQFIGNAITGAKNLIVSALRAIGRNGARAFREVDWKAVGKKALELIAKAVTGAGKLVFKALKAVGKAAMKKFTEIDWKDVGKNVVKGIAAGISAGVEKVKEAAKDAAKKALNAAKDFLGIHSPSKVAEKEIGLQYVLGIANGIKKNKDYAKKSAQEVGEAILQASEQRLNNMKVYHTVSLQQEKKYWDAVRKQVAKGTQARIDADAKYYEIAEQLQTEKQQSRLNSFIANYNKILKSAKSVADKLKKILKDDGETLLSSAEKWLTNQQVYHKTSLQYEVDYWNNIRKQLKKGTQARIDADAKYKESLASLKEAQKSAKQEAATLTKEYVKAYKSAASEVATQKRALEEQLKSDLQKIDSELDSQIKELNKQYEDAVKNRTSTIKGFYNVLDTAEQKEEEPVDLLSNVMNQVDALEQWDSTLTQLERKLGSDSSLYEELSGMGVDNLSTLKRFNKMSNAELQTYVAFYEKKNQIAERRAKAEHETLKADLEKQTNELKENAKKQGEELRQEYKTNAAKIEQDAAEQMESLTKQYSSDIKNLAKTVATQGESIGEQMIEGIKTGIEKTKSILMDASQTAVNDALNAAQQKLGISGTTSTSTAKKSTSNLSTATKLQTGLAGLQTSAVNKAILAPLLATAAGNNMTGKSTTNNVAINVYGANGQNERELADIISNRLNQTVQRRGTVFA